MARRDAPLEELIRISRVIGADPDLAQGGGGNTSVKSVDGRRIFVKASGTALKAMDRRRGWAELDLSALRKVLSVKGLAALPSREREAEVLRLLGRSVIRPPGARPSVESSLHALLDRVVIHTHPVGLNAFLSSRESRRRFRDLVGERYGEPLYVPYADPGYVLAARVEREIERYRARLGLSPAVVLLENHGLFVAAAEVEECLLLSKAVTRRGREFIGGGRVNSARSLLLIHDELSERLREALLVARAAPAVVARDSAAVAAEFLKRKEAVRAAERGAFTPDQIVYCRTYPLALPPARGLRGAGTFTVRAARAVALYRRRRGVDPRVLIVPGRGVFYAASDPGQLRIVAEVYRSALAVILHSPRAGGPRYLTRREARFIEGWEAEAFRRRQA